MRFTFLICFRLVFKVSSLFLVDRLVSGNRDCLQDSKNSPDGLRVAHPSAAALVVASRTAAFFFL